MNEKKQPNHQVKRLYVKLPQNLSEMDDAELNDWASQIVDRLWPQESLSGEEVLPPKESKK